MGDRSLPRKGRLTVINGASVRILELCSVETFYGRVRALSGVSLHVDRGEIVSLIGSNGAGKTTTLRTISGLLHPAAGSVRLNGEDITAVPAARRVRLGLCQVPEGRRLFPRMTVLDNLQLGAYTRRNMAGIQEDLERVFTLFPCLEQRVSQIAGELSGGDQQMLAMGRALMARPKVLMMDEPFLGLAPILVETIFRVIGEINEQGVPILLVEQNAHEALEIAHRAYILETGSIVKEEPGKKHLCLGGHGRRHHLADLTGRVASGD